jgi:DNA polymerase III epsilon subunit-like protein
MNEGQNIDTVLNNLTEDLRNVTKIVSHNIDFDINVILAECFKMENTNIIKKINSIEKYCTMKNGQSIMKVKKFPKLVELYKYIFQKDIYKEHRALSDVEICADCYFNLS